MFDVNAKTLRAELVGVDDASRPDGAVPTLARFVVDAVKPGRGKLD